MGKEILNRRQNIYSTEVPPEIVDSSGFIEATDYATDTTGGTVKVDDEYGVELTQAGKLRGTVETAAAYAEASNNLLVSKGTLDALNAAGVIGGGITWTKLYEGSVAASGTGTFEEGVDALDHKMIILQTIHDNGVTGHGACKLDIVPADTNTIKISVARSTSLYEITVTRTGFTFPSNMSANNFIVYVLD